MNTKTHDAITKLARLFEDGELLADTDPATFFAIVADEIVRLRIIATTRTGRKEQP